MLCPYVMVTRMWLFFAIIGLVLAIPGLIALVRGRLERAHIHTRIQALLVLAAASLAFAASMATNPNLPQPGASSPVVQASPVPSEPRAEVLRVIDGDTIVVNIDGELSTVRYLGINAPETVHPERPAQCFGPEATERNVALVGGRLVHLESDQPDRDQYGRLLRYVWVGGRMVNRMLVEEGYADLEPYSNRYADDFTRARDDAVNEGKGLWNTCILPTATAAPVAPSATTAAYSPPPCHLTDCDCPHFSTQQEAQRFFERAGGPATDPHRLDADRDGIACETLPRE